MRILLVDNDQIFLKIIQSFLSARGHEVVTAPDGLSALDKVSQFRPDFIFIDHVMPNIDGGTLCKMLKSDQRFDSSFIVILSAIAAEEWQKYGNYGADACIAKAPLNNMQKYLLEVIEDPSSAKDYCLSGNVIGIDELHQRTITKELLSSKKHLDCLLDNILEGVIELNSDYRIVYANPYALRIFNKKEKDILGISIEDLQPDKKGNRITDLIADNFDKESGRVVEKLLAFGNKYLLLKIIMINSGEPHYLVIITDLTEIKKNEISLLETNNFLKSILDSSCDVSIISTDLEQNITSWNKGAEKLFGYLADDVIGKEKITILYPTNSEIELSDSIRNAIVEESKSVSFEIREIRKDGREIWVKIHSAPMTNQKGEICGILGIGEDVTESKKLSGELKSSEERYRSVIEANPDPVVVYDMSGKVLYFNPAFTQVFGWELDEKLGQKMNDFVPDKNWPETKMMIEKVINGETFSSIETQRYNQLGDIIDVSVSASVYHDKDGIPIGSVINLRDITDQKRLELELVQAQKMESIGTLAGGIAHDFNNLLMGIQGRVSLLRMDVDSSGNSFENLNEIEAHIKSASELTNQLLGFARGGKYEIKPTNLNEIMDQSAKMFGRTRKEIRIEKHYDKSLWTVEVDRRQIEQIFLNLFVNAWQAMPNGGVLYLKTENILIDNSFNFKYHITSGKYVKISVTDTGSGMDEATKARVFEPFFSTKDKRRGTGLGLASVYGIIKNHNGFINVDSQEGHGTTFAVYLPASYKKAVSEPKISDKTIQGKGHILLIDDEKIVLDVLKEILMKIGYNVHTAMNGVDAIRLFREISNQIDLVILDMIMPEITGGEVFVKLKAIDPSVKVLLASGYSIDGQAAEIINRGCAGFIQKPFKMSELSEKIRDILDSQSVHSGGEPA